MYAYLLNDQDFRIDVSVPEATDDCTVGPNTCSNYYYVTFSIQDKPTDRAQLATNSTPYKIVFKRNDNNVCN